MRAIKMDNMIHERSYK